MKEADLMRHLQTFACRDPMVRLFRNNNGEGWVGKLVNKTQDEKGFRIVLQHARHIDFGLGTGTSDLIGGVSMLITPEMVGARVLVFAAPEVKTHLRTVTEHQKMFVHVVKSLGGLAGFVRSEDEMRKVLTYSRP